MVEKRKADSMDPIGKSLVIGGTGFIGLNIVRALKERTIDFRVTRRESSNTIFLRKFKPELVHASLEDEASLAKAMDGCRTVFMSAAHYPRFSTEKEEQVVQARRMLAACISASKRSGIERFVFTGSAATIGPSKTGRERSDESDAYFTPPSDSTYHALKCSLEQDLLDAASKDGFPAVILSAAGCIGEFDWKLGTNFFIPALAHGKLPYYCDGPINMVDARAVADAHVRAAALGKTGERYILGGRNITVGELLRLVATRYGFALESRPLSLSEARAYAASEEQRSQASGGRHRPLLSRVFVDIVSHGLNLDSGKAERSLDFRSPPIEESLDSAYTWFKKNRYLS